MHASTHRLLVVQANTLIRLSGDKLWKEPSVDTSRELRELNELLEDGLDANSGGMLDYACDQRWVAGVKALVLNGANPSTDGTLWITRNFLLNKKLKEESAEIYHVVRNPGQFRMQNAVIDSDFDA